MSSSTKTFSLRLLLCFAFAGPVGYVAYISAVAIHEILGHGLTAWLLGGRFEGFALMPDGMGWAAAWSDKHQNSVHAAGVVAGVLAGLIMLLLAVRLAHPLARMACLLFAICSFEDATSYAFWNSLFPRPPGDFAKILLDVHSELLRWSLVSGFGLAYLASTIGLNVMLFRCMESILGPLSRKRAILIAWVFFGLGGGAAWFGFDWNQLIQDIGRVPQFVGAGIQLAIAPLLVAVRRHAFASATVSKRCWVFSIGGAWLTTAVLVILLVAWLRHGVSW